MEDVTVVTLVNVGQAQYPVPIEILSTKYFLVSRFTRQSIDHDLSLINCLTIWQADISARISVCTLCERTYSFTTPYSYCLRVRCGITTTISYGPCSCNDRLES